LVLSCLLPLPQRPAQGLLLLFFPIFSVIKLRWQPRQYESNYIRLSLANNDSFTKTNHLKRITFTLDSSACTSSASLNCLLMSPRTTQTQSLFKITFYICSPVNTVQINSILVIYCQTACTDNRDSINVQMFKVFYMYFRTSKFFHFMFVRCRLVPPLVSFCPKCTFSFS